MRTASMFAGMAMAVAMMAATTASEAAPRLPHMSASSDLVTQVRDDYDEYEHGMRRRHEGDYRPWRSRRHHREFDGCRATRHMCAERFDWGSWRFRRCVRRHGC
jgi:hypothetical protein